MGKYYILISFIAFEKESFVKVVISFSRERVETQSGDFNKRKRTGTRCQIENHFPIETTEVFHTIFSIYLISSPYVTASYILLFKHTYKSSTSFIQNNDIIE